jgi:DNA-binding SARP family transcriptional activator
VDALWEDEPPETAAKAVHVHVSQLRKVLGKVRLPTRAPGYMLRIAEGEFDVDPYQHQEPEESFD